MRILISNSSKKPIYEQIYDAIRMNILSGSLEKNEKLPSIRALSKDLGVSIITVKRAYEELENDNYIISMQGRGSYVLDQDKDKLKEEHMEKIYKEVEKLVKKAKFLSIDKKDIDKMVEDAFKEGD